MSIKKIALTIAFLIIGFAVYHYWRDPLGVKLTIGAHTYYVETAVTDAEKEKGLGYRDSLKSDHGMLFIYDHPEQYQYWMKGMRFPLDFIWISNKTVIDITKNVHPTTDGQLPVYTPRLPVDKVLEVNAGVVDTDNIKIGDIIKIVF